MLVESMGARSRVPDTNPLDPVLREVGGAVAEAVRVLRHAQHAAEARAVAEVLDSSALRAAVALRDSPQGTTLDEPGTIERAAQAVRKAELEGAGLPRLVGRIKRSSKYAYQAPTTDGGWFDVTVAQEWVGHTGYIFHGNRNRYCRIDLALGLRADDGSVVDLDARGRR